VNFQKFIISEYFPEIFRRQQRGHAAKGSQWNVQTKAI